jgi:hypothetical protein
MKKYYPLHNMTLKYSTSILLHNENTLNTQLNLKEVKKQLSKVLSENQINHWPNTTTIAADYSYQL